MGALAPVLAGALTLVPVPDPAPDPCMRLVLSRPPRPPRMVRFVWRVTMSFTFTIASSAMILATVAVSCVMTAQSIAVAVAKLAMA